MLEVHVIFTGAVQRVGFRAATKRMAEELKLTGYVKNLPDGSVELVAQGSKATLQQFLAALHKRFQIHEAMEKYTEISKPYSSFQVTL